MKLVEVKPILYLNANKEYIDEDLHHKLCDHFVVYLIPEHDDPVLISPFNGDKIVGREALIARLNKLAQDEMFFALAEELYIINVPDVPTHEDTNREVLARLQQLVYNPMILIFNDYTKMPYLHNCISGAYSWGRDEVLADLDNMLEYSRALAERFDEGFGS